MLRKVGIPMDDEDLDPVTDLIEINAREMNKLA
jgi:hypothetical protein